MAKKDRFLTLEEVLKGNVTEEYLDKKEKIAIIHRHIARLNEKGFDIDDKLYYYPEREDLKAERKKINDKISKLTYELKELEESIK